MRRPLTTLSQRAAVAVQTRRTPSRLAGADREAGMTTAEYAVGTVAAAGFGGVLITCISQPAVKDLLLKTVLSAIKHFGTFF